MIILYRLVLSAVLSVIALVLLNLLNNGSIDTFTFDPIAFSVVFIAIALCALISPSLGQLTMSLPSLSSEERERGQVKWFNVSKGYGFVTRESGEDVFVHFRSIRGEGRRMLREGQSVEFTVVDGDKGPQAENVSPLNSK